MKVDSRQNKNSNSAFSEGRAQRPAGTKSVWPALLALGGGCSFLVPASAIELGDIQVRSTIGQPLRASINVLLHPSEQIYAHCIYLSPGRSESGVPAAVDATITLTQDAINLTGKSAVKEPLIALQLNVDCPAAAHLRRDYLMFIDPALPPQAEPATAPVVAAARRRASAPIGAAPAPRRDISRPPVPADSRYQVQPGDSLSGIATRITGRRVGVWQAVDALFAANPGAFIDSNPDLLLAGAVLAIPDAITTAPSAAPPAGGSGRQENPVQTPAAPAATNPVAEQPAQAGPVYAREKTGGTSAEAPVATPAEARGTTAAQGANPVPAPQPGDIAVGGPDNPFVSPIEISGEPVAAEDPPVQQPKAESGNTGQTARLQPGVINTSGATSDSWSWFIWLGGSGIALILALLVFGRRLKQHFRPALPHSAASERGIGPFDETAEIDAVAVHDRSSDSEPVPRMLSLHAEFNDGFDTHGDIEVAEDFGFSDSGHFGEQAPSHAPQYQRERSILDSETPPSRDDTGEYDVSMILDATKQALDVSEDSTRDLRAIEVEVETSEETGTFTLRGDMDYNILEQDYEDELTATQALNAEIARAARDLTLEFERGPDRSNSSAEETSELPIEDMLERNGDETAAMATSNPENGDTVEMPSAPGEDDSGGTESNKDLAAETAAAQNDPTVEMEVEPTPRKAGKARAS